MCSQLALEQYLDNLENLSPELTRNFKTIYDLDTKVQNILIEIDELKASYLSNIKSMDTETRLLKMKEIDKKYELSKRFSDEKVQLANNTYELVDKHIRRLDTDLARFELEYKEKSSLQRHDHDHLNATSGLNASHLNANATLNASANTTITTETVGTSKSRKSKKKVEQPTVIIEETAGNNSLMPITSLGLSLAQPGGIDVLDMPVDPNEPTYCICKQVSFGNMIGCDNSECPIEWFHFGCMNLSTKPKGKWYCPPCSEKRKNKS
jgi:hypothetical protein